MGCSVISKGGQVCANCQITVSNSYHEFSNALAILIIDCILVTANFLDKLLVA